MKLNIKGVAGTVCLMLIFSTGFSQYNWKLSKDKDGIRVYLSEAANSNFKSIKVECTLKGNYEKLIAVLTNPDGLKDWSFNTKVSFIIKKNNPYDLVYYTETSVPWPLSNRDVVIHLKINRDSLPGCLKVTAVNEDDYIGEVISKVRIPHLSIHWHVTMPTVKSVKIIYIIEADPGGGIPAWLVNKFANKGPYESFKKLSEILKEY